MAIWFISAFAAYFVKGVCGFANTLVFSTILSFTHNNVNISPVEVLLGIPSNVVMAWRSRKTIDWKMCARLILMVMLGSIPGILLLKNTDATLIKVLFGFVIMGIGIEMLLRKPGAAKKQSKFALAFIGILSGVLCGLYGIGALLSAYISRVTDNMDTFKANLAIVFLADNFIRCIEYAVMGIMTFEVIKQALILSPAMAAGFACGMFGTRFLSEKTVRRVVTVMLVVSGAALIVNSLIR